MLFLYLWREMVHTLVDSHYALYITYSQQQGLLGFNL